MFTRVRLLRSSEYEPISNRFQMDSEWKVAYLMPLSKSNDFPDHLDQMLIGWTPIGRAVSQFEPEIVEPLSIVSRPWCILQCKLLNASKWKPLNVNLQCMKFIQTQSISMRISQCKPPKKPWSLNVEPLKVSLWNSMCSARMWPLEGRHPIRPMATALPQITLNN